MFQRTALLGLAAALPLLAQDPIPPAGGFPVRSRTDLPIAWVDGYRTRLDVWWPDHASPPTGWPAVICAHGGDASRKTPRIQARGRHLASRGYIAIAFDWRGNGVTEALNGPGGQQAFDLHIRDNAEAFQLVPGLLPAGTTLDPLRLAMTGISAGGRQTWRCGSFSGQPLPTPSGAITTFPALSAIATQACHLDPIEDLVPGGVTFRADLARTLFGLPATDPRRTAMLAEDYAGLAAELRATPLFDILPLVQQQNLVPTLVVKAFHDVDHLIAPTVTALPTLQPGVVQKLLLTTGVHGNATNAIEDAVVDDSIGRFFDLHLKGFANGIDLEPPVEVAVVPADPARYRQANSAWGHRVLPAWPPAVATETLHLDATGRLASAPPVGAGSVTIAHRIGAGYDLVGFLNDGATPGTTVAAGKLTLVSRSFDGAPLGADLELLGQPVLDAEITVTVGDHQLGATLFDVPPAGAAVPITWGHVAERGAAAGVREIRLTFEHCAYVVPAGHRLRLVLENLPIRRTPLTAGYFVAPYFVDVDTTVELGAVRPARLELPVDDTPAASLLPRLGIASAAAGIDHRLRVEAGVARAGLPFLVLIGASGHGPGVQILGTDVPLNFDVWTGLGTAAAGVAPFVGFIGLLDATGRADARFRVPAGPLATSLLGLRFTFACGGPIAGGIWAGGPAVLDIRP